MLTRHLVNIVSVAGSLPEFYCYHSFCLFLTITLFSFSLFIVYFLFVPRDKQTNPCLVLPRLIRSHLIHRVDRKLFLILSTPNFCPPDVTFVTCCGRGRFKLQPMERRGQRSKVAWRSPQEGLDDLAKKLFDN